MLYFALWRIGFQAAVQYRVEMAVWVLVDVLPPIMMVFLWLTAYEGQASVAGYSLDAMLQYTIALTVVNNFITAHVEWDIVYGIRTGELSARLAKPVNMWLFWFFNGMGSRTVRGLLAAPWLAICIVWLSPYLRVPSVEPGQVAPLVACFVLAYLLSFFSKITLGFLGFWLSEISGVVGLVEMAMWVFGGMLVPLELLPEPLRAVAGFMPFQYIYFIPLSAMLGRLGEAELRAALVTQMAWIVGLALLAGLVWRAGLRKYEAYGG